MPKFPWGFNRVFKYIGFCAVGTALAGRKVEVMDKKLEAGISAAVLFGLNFFLSFCNLTTGIMWFVTAFIGVVAVIQISQLVNENKILQYLGRISLIVLCIPLLFSFPPSMAQLLQQPHMPYYILPS